MQVYMEIQKNFHPEKDHLGAISRGLGESRLLNKYAGILLQYSKTRKGTYICQHYRSQKYSVFNEQLYKKQVNYNLYKHIDTIQFTFYKDSK